MLRNRFQTTLLSLLQKHIGNHKFKSLKKLIYKTSSNRFYVHAPKVKARDIKTTVKYVIRYSGKSAIVDYDGEFVTFWYDRHEDNKHITEKIPTKIVLQMDMLDPGDPTYSPMFDCEKCGFPMKPVFFIGYTGIEYTYDGN